MESIYGAAVIEGENGDKVLTFWPYCKECKMPYTFAPDEPFAFCNCGTTEWGEPRPAPWVYNPTQLIGLLAATGYDNEDCRYDHHDYCQNHRLHSKPCPYPEVVKIVDEYNAKVHPNERFDT